MKLSTTELRMLKKIVAFVNDGAEGNKLSAKYLAEMYDITDPYERKVFRRLVNRIKHGTVKSKYLKKCPKCGTTELYGGYFYYCDGESIRFKFGQVNSQMLELAPELFNALKDGINLKCSGCNLAVKYTVSTGETVED